MSRWQKLTAILLALILIVSYPIYRWIQIQQAPIMDNFHNPEAWVASLKNDKQAGAKVYEQFCATCHAKDPDIKVKAPRIGVITDWQPFQKGGIAAMLAVVNNGTQKMPARGGCFECSDDLLRQAIQYMLPLTPESKKKGKS